MENGPGRPKRAAPDACFRVCHNRHLADNTGILQPTYSMPPQRDMVHQSLPLLYAHCLKWRLENVEQIGAVIMFRNTGEGGGVEAWRYAAL